MSEISDKFKNSVEYDLMVSDFGLKLMEKYQLFNKIHESTVSQVFIIRDQETNELYTLKVISRGNDYSWDMETIKQINHPKIARVIDVQSTDKYIYILKEYIKGFTLEEYVAKNSPLAETTVLEMGMEICGILEYFHSIKPSPIIYRDLKPANLIVMPTGELKLIDTESIRQFKQEVKKDTFYIGTDGYASPEQFGFGQTDSRSDIYALGSTLFYLLTGIKPEIDKYKLKNVKSIRGDVSDSLNDVIKKCTEFHPDGRYQQVSVLKNELSNLLKTDPVSKSLHLLKRVLKNKTVRNGALLISIGFIAFALYSGVDARNRVKSSSEAALNGLVLTTEPSPSLSVIATPSISSSASSSVSSSSEYPASFFDKTTILEAFWSGEVPQKLPDEFIDYYKQQTAYKVNPNIFFISIKEWVFGSDHEQMTERINSAGGNLLLRAEGQVDVPVMMNSDSMTAGDGRAQLYFVYLQDDKDMVDNVKYQIVDPTGHWISGQDVYVERSTETTSSVSETIPSVSDSSVFNKTTILEAFWSGEIPKLLPDSYIDQYKSQDAFRYRSDTFYISIKEWIPDSTEQMADRIKAVGGKLVLRAEGYNDVAFEMLSHSMTRSDGSVVVYFAYLQDAQKMISGVQYQIVDESGHWVVNDGVCVERPID